MFFVCTVQNKQKQAWAWKRGNAKKWNVLNKWAKTSKNKWALKQAKTSKNKWAPKWAKPSKNKQRANVGATFLQRHQKLAQDRQAAFFRPLATYTVGECPALELLPRHLGMLSLVSPKAECLRWKRCPTALAWGKSWLVSCPCHGPRCLSVSPLRKSRTRKGFVPCKGWQGLFCLILSSTRFVFFSFLEIHVCSVL